ncbi:O-antigen ligase [Hathewaya proteolytica DSM 3090]|uniref:O-antigen ligase n=1 Tax=Hathewaya proteolytica DSM 3090 TaxID=1121331 RepID=A0A1M6PSU4_9CLOT|nr:O-antigen ligase family protein [Hathewaya proteolytica]SHK10971.1 O-antigen ligase [Hathewaya proteolytica DSM 3090]
MIKLMDNIAKITENKFKNKYFRYGILFAMLFFTSGIALGEYAVVKLMKYIYFSALTFFVTIYILKDKHLREKLLGFNVLFLSVMAFSILSSIWSVYHLETLKNAYFLCITTIPAIYIGITYDKEEFFHMIFIWFLALGIINLYISIIGLPGTIQLEEMRYAFRPIKGLFKHRNTLGLYSVLGAGISVWMYINSEKNKKRRKMSVACMVICLMLIYLSKSMTSLLLLPVMIFLVLACRNRKLASMTLIFIIPGIILILLIIVTSPPFYVKILERMGRDASLTSRSVIWDGVLRGIVAKPFLGFGFSAFLTANVYGKCYIRNIYGSIPPSAHNGFLELMVDFGGLCTIFIIGMLIMTLRKMKKLNLHIKDNNYLSFIISFVVYVFLFNLVESPIIKQFSTIYIFLVVFSNILQREEKESSL